MEISKINTVFAMAICFIIGVLVSLPHEEKIVFRDIVKPANVKLKLDQMKYVKECSVSINDITFVVGSMDDEANTTFYVGGTGVSVSKESTNYVDSFEVNVWY